MIDAPATLRAFLLAKPTLTAVVGTRLWPERFEPPPGYTPAQGPGIAFRSRGGRIDYSNTILHNSFQFKCYGSTEMVANTGYRALVDVLHEAQGGGLRWAELEIAGQTVTEPETGWNYVLCFFETQMLAGVLA